MSEIAKRVPAAPAAAPRNLPPLAPAPAPRRFSQRMAGTMLGGAGLALLAGRPVLGRFCLGSYLYHLLRGEASFANRTLPWSPAE
jgi:predicted lipid-binding transport protein (Tim44 family)